MMMNLRWKTIVSSSFFVFSIYNQQCTFFLFSVFAPDWNGIDIQASRIWVVCLPQILKIIAFLSLNENTWLHVWRWDSVSVVFVWEWELFAYVPYGTPFLPGKEKWILFKQPHITNVPQRALQSAFKRLKHWINLPLHLLTDMQYMSCVQNNQHGKMTPWAGRTK